MKEADDSFQILALDGGGIKGIFSAAVLAKLEEDCHVRIVDHFDLIVGTSTGGIIALALGLGLSPREIVEFYVTRGASIFAGGLFNGAMRYMRRKYGNQGLISALQVCFGETRLANSKKRLVVTAYNLDRDDVYLFKTPHHERLRRDFKVPMWKVALATSAAPTCFPCCREIDDIRLIDGGVWANNPTMVGVAEAVSMLGININTISVLNLGTSDPVIHRKDDLNEGGLIAWSKTAVDVIMRGQSRGAFTQAQHLLGTERIERIDPRVPDGLFALDKLSVRQLLSHAASESRTFCPTFERKFAPHVASPYTPLYGCNEEKVHASV